MRIDVSCLRESITTCVEEGIKYYSEYELKTGSNASSANTFSSSYAMEADPRAVAAIPAEVHMISGCQDRQTSADVSNVATFDLPDPAGRAGGACTSALLEVLYQEQQTSNQSLSFQEVLLKMREILKDKRFSQIPQLTSSRPLDVKSQFRIVPDNFSGTKRAVIIGINYEGQQGQLSGCHNDAKNMKEYLMNVHGFPEENMIMLLDDGICTSPTRNNIIDAFEKLVSVSSSGDACFVHYSGHGGKLPDDNGDEEDGYDETLIPLDYKSAGQIRDDELYAVLACAMPSGVNLTCLMDCCHSGTILDLPYIFVADGQSEQMTLDEGFNFSALIELAYVLKNMKVNSIGDAIKTGTRIYTLIKKANIPWDKIFNKK